MRSFGLAERKLEEAYFFLDKVTSARLLDMGYYFSAFVAASRSVTFAVQGCLNGASGFEEWYGGWQARLRGDPLARLFHECRTDGQHLGVCPITGGAGDREGRSSFCSGRAPAPASSGFPTPTW
jgi:hypothetical protein